MSRYSLAAESSIPNKHCQERPSLWAKFRSEYFVVARVEALLAMRRTSPRSSPKRLAFRRNFRNQVAPGVFDLDALETSPVHGGAKGTSTNSKHCKNQAMSKCSTTERARHTTNRSTKDRATKDRAAIADTATKPSSPRIYPAGCTDKPLGLFIGQAPPKRIENLPPEYKPLEGQPERRLARLAGFETPDELWAMFDRIDLLGFWPGPKNRAAHHRISTGYRKHNCDGHRFPMLHARLAADRLKGQGGLCRKYEVAVLCGKKVAAAFGLLGISTRTLPWTEEFDGIRFFVLPHPSGASHLWNDEEFWHRSASTFRVVLETVRKLPRAILPPEVSLSSNKIRCVGANQTNSIRVETSKHGVVRSRFFTRKPSDADVNADAFLPGSACNSWCKTPMTTEPVGTECTSDALCSPVLASAGEANSLSESMCKAPVLADTDQMGYASGILFMAVPTERLDPASEITF